MPRFCQLGPNCVGPKKEIARAGYPIGIIPGPPYKKGQRFCSAACKAIDYNERKNEKRAGVQKQQQARAARDKAVSDRKIARLKKKGHTCCPNPDCGRPFDEK